MGSLVEKTARPVAAVKGAAGSIVQRCSSAHIKRLIWYTQPERFNQLQAMLVFNYAEGAMQCGLFSIKQSCPARVYTQIAEWSPFGTNTSQEPLERLYI